MKFFVSRIKKWRLTYGQLSIVFACAIGLALLTYPRALPFDKSENITTDKVREVTESTHYIVSNVKTRPTTTEFTNSAVRFSSRLIEYHSTLPVAIEDIQQTLKILDEDIVQKRKARGLTVYQSPSYWNTELLQRQVLIVTSWRSGSTFLGEILSSHPSVFHHFEPLVYAGANQIRSGQPASEAVDHLNNLFNCRFKNRKYQLQLVRKQRFLLSRNIQLWNTCLQSPNQHTCADPSFLEQACRRFPVILAKTVRLRLTLTLPLLTDPRLRHLKIIYLVRDPRATMNSRYQLADWCKSEDCANPSQLCNDLFGDLAAFHMLSAQFPGRLKLLKYEQLARDPHKTFHELFQFVDLDLLASVNETITKHTVDEVDKNGPWGTFHDSIERIDLWKQKLTRQQIENIQIACSSVLQKLDYPLI